MGRLHTASVLLLLGLLFLAALTAFLLAHLAGGVDALADEAPSPTAVHEAIRRGAAWLAAAHAGGFEDRTYHDPVELVVLALHHAGTSHEDPVFRRGLEVVTTARPSFTYRVSVMAMALAEINPGQYRERLAHAAQWLVDTQLAGGEWGYPGTLVGRQSRVRAVAVQPPDLPGEEEGRPASIPIERRASTPMVAGEKGDFSNTQFAILGLRACRDAGIGIPKATWQAALGYLARSQREDGGWGYDAGGTPDEASYASLTAAGACGAAICLAALGKDVASDAVVRKARAWLDRRFDPARNAGIDRSSVVGPSTWQLYHLYSVERVGSVLGWKEIGGRPWYPAGAAELLRTQRPDGSWQDPAGAGERDRARYLTTADTCFAILFLARATPPLTGSR
jgi:hypothetical protein